MTALEEVFAETMPTDMGYDYIGMSFQEKCAAARRAGQRHLRFSLFFVFLILAAQYESWSLPFSVLLCTPIAVFGAFVALWALGIGKRRVHPDRSRDAHRAVGQERDPHRGVREGGI